jgi:hypothetical protein
MKIRKRKNPIVKYRIQKNLERILKIVGIKLPLEILIIYLGLHSVREVVNLKIL